MADDETTPLTAADAPAPEEKPEVSDMPVERPKVEVKQMGGAKVTKIVGRKKDDINMDELEMDDDLRKALKRSKDRKKQKSKRLQYNFLFKSGAFLVMLFFVLIMKQVQKLFPDKDEGATATASTATPKTPPITEAPAVTDHVTGKPKEEEL